jgi:adenosylcobinamide-GDP ribazoletransferase
MRAPRGPARALALLTVLPVPAGDGDLGAAAGWFPAVGALVGLLAGVAWLVVEPALGPGVASVLAVVVLAGLTAALHQDGLADCADALGVRGDRQRRLAVMRDSTIGVYGGLALVLSVLLLAATLAALPQGEVLPTLVVACALARWAAVLHAVAVAPARPDGLGAAFVPGVAAVAVATAVAVAVAVALADGPGTAAIAAAAVVALAVSLWARRSLGGRTGDTLGATVALAEVAVCLVLLGFAS